MGKSVFASAKYLSPSFLFFFSLSGERIKTMHEFIKKVYRIFLNLPEDIHLLWRFQPLPNVVKQ